MVGMALAGGTGGTGGTGGGRRAEIERVLEETGIVARSTPAGRRVDVDGVHTNVSLSRFLRLFELVIEDSAAEGCCLPLVLRFLWETSRGKQDLLDFLGVVDAYTPVSSTAPIGDWSAEQREHFLTARLSREALGDARGIERACLRLLENGCSSERRQAADMELVAASLSSAHAFKPAVKMSQHPYRTGKPKPDCVEVVIREIFDLLLFDKDESRFNPDARLPPTASPAVRAFYETYGEVHASADGSHGAAAGIDADALEADRSRRWFELCCALPGVEYTSSSTDQLQADLSMITMSSAVRNRITAAAAATAAASTTAATETNIRSHDRNDDLASTSMRDDSDDGAAAAADAAVAVVFDYELVPTLANVSKCLGALLFGWDGSNNHGSSFTSLKDVQEAWQGVEWGDAADSMPRLDVGEKRTSYRAPLAEETVWREVGTLGLRGEHHSIEFDLERLHNLAVTRHKRSDVQWTKTPRARALEQWLHRTPGEERTPAHPFVSALQPALLGDGMLRALATHTASASRRAKATATSMTTPRDIGALKGKLVQGWLASKWDQDRRSLSTLEETDLASCSEGGHLFSSTDSQVKAEEFEQVLRALDLLVAINNMEESSCSDNDDGSARRLFTADMLAWILPKLYLEDHQQPWGGQDHQQPWGGLSGANIIRVGRALGEMPPNTIGTAECVVGLDRHHANRVGEIRIEIRGND